MADNKQVTLERIKAPLGKTMEEYELFLRQALHSESRYFDEILKYIFDNRGKGVRPTLVMLTAGLMAGKEHKHSQRVLLSAALEVSDP